MRLFFPLSGKRFEKQQFLVTIAGLLITVLAFFFMLKVERDREAFQFENSARLGIHSIKNQIKANLGVLRSLYDFYAGSEEVTREEFSVFTGPVLERFPSIQALEWIPHVADSERVAYEASARHDGLTDFRITERLYQGKMKPAEKRDEYYPVYFLEPMTGNEAALGFDLRSNPAREKALNQARDSGELVITDRITLVQETGRQYGYLALLPIYEGKKTPPSLTERRQKLLGFVLGAYRFESLMNELRRTDSILKKHEFEILNVSDGAGEELLYSSLRADLTGDAAIPENYPYSVSNSMEIGSQQWSIVSYPLPEDIKGYTAWTPWMVLISGLMLTMLLSFHLWERHRKEELLVKALANAKTASQAKTDFLATISHEVRTPLNGVIGISDLMLDEFLSPTQTRYMETIRNSGLNLLALINEVLDFTKMVENEVNLDQNQFNPEALVKASAAQLKLDAQEKGIELSCAMDEALPPVLLGDAHRLQRVLINLIGNAIKFTDDGTVRVQVGVLSRSDDQVMLRFEVADTGNGISEEFIPQLFDAFTQEDSSLSRRYCGTGLGLSICQRIIQLMGSDIQVESTLGKGSRFWFDILFETSGEQVKPSPAIPCQCPDKDLEPCTRSQKILLVEDSESNRLITQIYLEKMGHLTTLARDGFEAISAFQSQDFDLILMDIQMPGLDGLTATKNIRKSNQGIPIIAVSAHILPGDRQRYLKAGMNDLIAKPFTKCDLQDMINRWTPMVHTG